MLRRMMEDVVNIHQGFNGSRHVILQPHHYFSCCKMAGANSGHKGDDAREGRALESREWKPESLAQCLYSLVEEEVTAWNCV